MFTKFLHNSLLIGLLLLLCSSIILPNLRIEVNEGKLEVAGRIRNEKKKNLDSARIVVKDSSGRTVLDEVYTDSKGKFKLDLSYNQKVRTYFEKDGYVTMFATFDTKVPSTKTYKTLYYEAAITLLDDSSNFNKQTAKVEPFMKVAYNPGYEIFIEDLDHTLSFIDQVTEPNVGKLQIAGAVVDSTADSAAVNVLIEVHDSLGRILSAVKTDPQGKYELEVPLMSKSKLYLTGEKYHKSHANIEGFVPVENKEDVFTLNHDLIVIPKTEKISNAVIRLPQNQIAFDTLSRAFVDDTTTRVNYNYAVEVTKRRLLLTGIVLGRGSTPLNRMDIEILAGDAPFGEYKIEKDTYRVELPYQSIVHVNYKAKGYHPIFVSLNTNMDFDQMDSITRFDVPVQMIAKDNSDINPDAFDLPAKNFYYDDITGGFEEDTAATNEFAKKLGEDDGQIRDTSIANGFLELTATVFEPATNGKIEEGRVRILNENKAVISSITTDKKGKFTADLGLNKIYYLEFEKEEHYPTMVKFDTKVPAGRENQNIQQGGLRAPIIHKENQIMGKTIPPSLIEGREITAYFFSEEDDMFVEDMDVYLAFEDDVRKYMPPRQEAPKPPKDTIPPIQAITIKGIAMNKLNEPLADLDITLLEDGKKIETTKTDEQGRFTSTLPINKSLTAEFSKKGYHTSTLAFDTKLEKPRKMKQPTITVPSLTMYAEDDLATNPAAFAKNTRKYSLDQKATALNADPLVEKEFNETLAIIPDNQKLALEGKIKDANGKTIESALIMVYEGATLVDSVRSDEKGNYELLLAYQKDYRIVIEDVDYFRSYAAVSTKTNVSNERLVDKKVKGLDLIIVNRKEAKVNPMAFLKPFTRVKFDVDKDEFVEVDEVEDNFMANLYVKPDPAPKEEKEKKPKEEKEKKKRKKEVQLDTEEITAKQIIAELPTEEKSGPTVSTAAAARQQQKKTNKNLAVKNEVMGDFRNMLQGIQTQRVRSMRDVNLDMERIVNTGYTVSSAPKDEVDENMIKALETRQMLNQIVAEALGYRRSDIQPVSTDSIFNINYSYQMKHIQEGFGVYVVDRDWVYHKNTITQYVKETNWWILNSYFKNGEEISGSIYEKELTALKQQKAANNQSN